MYLLSCFLLLYKVSTNLDNQVVIVCALIICLLRCQVILYKLSGDTIMSDDEKSSSELMKKWVYVGYVRAHTHDVRGLTVAVPISREGLYLGF